MSIVPVEFVEKWQNTSQLEEQGAQSWFNDLCGLLRHPEPTGNLNGLEFTFEKRVKTGKADAYYENHFGWEFKSIGKSLEEAMGQVLGYSMYLKTPPLLIASDFKNIVIRTNFPGMECVEHKIYITDLLRQETLATLGNAFRNPEAFNTGKSRADVTKETATLFEDIRANMAGNTRTQFDAIKLTRYLNQIIFCLYAEDANLLPAGTFTELITQQWKDPAKFQAGTNDLFQKMNSGGIFGPKTISHFNGEMFADIPNVRLNDWALIKLVLVKEMNWSNIEPSIFGTLFERALGLTHQQAPLGAHYTSEADIMRVVKPVIIDDLNEQLQQALDESQNTSDATEGINRIQRFRDELAGVTVLDPACGSGNFLYVTLKAMLDIEREAIDAQIALGSPQSTPKVSPSQMMGLEKNEEATQLAKTALWIGYIQWHQANGFEYTNRPILDNISGVECRDAVLTQNANGTAKARWPKADYIIGNPPFLGAKDMLTELGSDYTGQLRQTYADELNGAVDLCCYWFEQAREQIETGKAKRAGLLATQAIRFSSNRRTLERIKETGNIFAAYDDLEWKPEELGSAAVHVSIVCFDDGSETTKKLNGSPAKDIDTRLTDSMYLDQAQKLPQNAGICFAGVSKGGPFDLTPQQAMEMLNDSNPNGKPNGDVVKRYITGSDLNGKPKERWLVDFGTKPEAEAMLYNLPYQHCLRHVKPVRAKNRREHRRTNWWMFSDATPALSAAITPLNHYIGTCQIAKHRIFHLIGARTTPNNKVTVFAREDNYFLGILESKIHKVWAAATGTQLREKESAKTYIIGDCFEKFPFPKPTQGQKQAIEQAAHTLDMQRRNVCQPNGTYRRSMNSLYNENPPWLQAAHDDLDKAVSNAYGWHHQMADTQILRKLVALNLSGNAGMP